MSFENGISCFKVLVKKSRENALDSSCSLSWTFCHIRKIASCACAGNAGNVFPPPTSMETTCQRSRHASRHVRHTRAVMHVGIAYPRWRGKRSRHSRRMRNPTKLLLSSGYQGVIIRLPLYINHSSNSPSELVSHRYQDSPTRAVYGAQNLTQMMRLQQILSSRTQAEACPM